MPLFCHQAFNLLSALNKKAIKALAFLKISLWDQVKNVRELNVRNGDVGINESAFQISVAFQKPLIHQLRT